MLMTRHTMLMQRRRKSARRDRTDAPMILRARDHAMPSSHRDEVRAVPRD